MSTSNTVRLSIEIPTEVNEQLASFLEWGMKADVMRAMIELLIRTYLTDNRYIAQDLLNGRCKFIVQDLNSTGKPICETCDD